ncbi:nuclear pore complex protein NUP205 isoform X2 [Iris pallida]|uniref:Nuclear pore complex protein NUP205 isoform X2 n=1 Tax=Iris pallida TaxID=29817 RepID=A0AAX6DQI5_IRIPA|nr:nuclear pore complex protein NUP205 isoform X2 [Iris pallida]
MVLLLVSSECNKIAYNGREIPQFSFAAILDADHLMESQEQNLSTDVRAVHVKLDLDFKDPNWKKHYQDDFDNRFNLPHLKDILDVKPRPTTFSVVSR